jgi:DNA-directed RNA polymerase specialized sigma24 family protein
VTLLHTAAQPRSSSDAAAIAASLDSPAAFAVVFERHHAVVHRYLARRIGRDLADELAAETFAVAFTKRGRYDLSFEDARPWLFGIATKLAHRHWRREERELRAYARTGVDAAAPSPAERVTARADSAVAGSGDRRCACRADRGRARRAAAVRVGGAGPTRDRGGPVDCARHRQVAPASRTCTRASIARRCR